MSRPREAKRVFSRLVIVAVIGLLIIAAAYAVLARPRSTKIATAAPTKTAASPSPTASTEPINPAMGVQGSPASATPSIQAAPAPTTSTLPAPTGQLYSAGPSVSLSANTPEESVCQTIIDANCSIVLVSPSSAQVAFVAPPTGDDGGHLVDWKLQQYIKSPGAWQIFAQASLNGQTSNSPRYNFEVNP